MTYQVMTNALGDSIWIQGGESQLTPLSPNNCENERILRNLCDLLKSRSNQSESGMGGDKSKNSHVGKICKDCSWVYKISPNYICRNGWQHAGVSLDGQEPACPNFVSRA